MGYLWIPIIRYKSAFHKWNSTSSSESLCFPWYILHFSVIFHLFLWDSILPSERLSSPMRCNLVLYPHTLQCDSIFSSEIFPFALRVNLCEWVLLPLVSEISSSPERAPTLEGESTLFGKIPRPSLRSHHFH